MKEKRIPVATQGKYKPSIVCKLLSEKSGTQISIAFHTKAWKYYDNGQWKKETNEDAGIKGEAK
jgi:hypothetical protein